MSACLIAILSLIVFRAPAQDPALPSGLDPVEPALPAGLDDLDVSPMPSVEPSLPAGLEDTEPALPSGLMGTSAEPGLPSGLGGEDDAAPEVNGIDIEPAPVSFGLTPEVNGFAEIRMGSRLRSDTDQKDMSLGEFRLHLESMKSLHGATLSAQADLLYDPVLDDHHINIERGLGWLDVREASLLVRPISFMDVKFGRQTLTWGAGDLLFINDLFPKDWNSFLIGRDEEYLKAPSDAVKVSLFSDVVNLDAVYTPSFDPDRYIDGGRLSYFNMNQGMVVGRGSPVVTSIPDRWFTDDELALRLHRMVGSWESALYAYNGYWKSPAGFNPSAGRFTFPGLAVYGGSLRGPLAGSIASVEFGYYDSLDDRSGGDPMIRNSEWRFLAGLEKELVPQFIVGVQYYLESMSDHDEFLGSLPSGAIPLDRNRHLMTLRLTKLLMNQNLNLSLFSFFSPSEMDVYFRPRATYKINDSWTFEAGGNIFSGQDTHTFFGQFADNTNVYVSLRFGF